MALRQTRIQGNRRFLDGDRHPPALPESEKATCGLLCCSLLGSPELIFDQPAGFFSVHQRAGLIIDDGTGDELDWAVQHEGVRQYVLVQHPGCTVPGSACGDAAAFAERLRERLPKDCALHIAELDGDRKVRFLD